VWVWLIWDLLEGGRSCYADVDSKQTLWRSLEDTWYRRFAVLQNRRQFLNTELSNCSGLCSTVKLF